MLPHVTTCTIYGPLFFMKVLRSHVLGLVFFWIYMTYDVKCIKSINQYVGRSKRKNVEKSMFERTPCFDRLFYLDPLCKTEAGQLVVCGWQRREWLGLY